jgi:hypothetical protein
MQLQRQTRPLPQAIGKITRALILSLSVCYHARLQDRDTYEGGVSEQFKLNPLSLPGGVGRFRDEIRWLVLGILFILATKFGYFLNYVHLYSLAIIL